MKPCFSRQDKSSFWGGHTPKLKRDGSENKQNQYIEQLTPEFSQSSDATVLSPVQQELDVSGSWDISFLRYYYTAEVTDTIEPMYIEIDSIIFAILCSIEDELCFRCGCP